MAGGEGFLILPQFPWPQPGHRSGKLKLRSPLLSVLPAGFHPASSHLETFITTQPKSKLGRALISGRRLPTHHLNTNSIIQGSLNQEPLNFKNTSIPKKNMCTVHSTHRLSWYFYLLAKGLFSNHMHDRYELRGEYVLCWQSGILF